MTSIDLVRQRIMQALDDHRANLDGGAPLSRVDITVFFNMRSGAPGDVEVRITTKSEPKRQRELDALASRDHRGVSMAGDYEKALGT